MAAAQILQQQASLTRKARRIHFSGFPIGTTAPMLQAFVQGAMDSAKLTLPTPGSCIIEVNLGQDARYSFIEFRSVFEAGNVLMLDGVNMGGSVLRIQRPKDFTPAPPETMMLVIPAGIQSATPAALITGTSVSTTMPIINSQPPKAVQPVSEQANLQSVTRRARRLHVGNLPTGASLTAELLKQFFSAMLVSKGLADSRIEGDPVVNCTIPNQKYGFVELRTIHETTRALTLNGMELGDRKLRIQRPHDYQPVPMDMQRRYAELMGQPPPPEDLSAPKSLPQPTSLVPSAGQVPSGDAKQNSDV
mmetsp:Transcript_11745/g.16412  ORF Transcript_11745/g.16412 Transcript_11745/m.16412 type:complete len:305 (-) Transcript_11745:89-1003(-)